MEKLTAALLTWWRRAYSRRWSVCNRVRQRCADEKRGTKLGTVIIISTLILMAVAFIYFILADYQIEPEDQMFVVVWIFSGIYYPLAWL